MFHSTLGCEGHRHGVDMSPSVFSSLFSHDERQPDNVNGIVWGLWGSRHSYISSLVCFFFLCFYILLMVITGTKNGHYHYNTTSLLPPPLVLESPVRSGFGLFFCRTVTGPVLEIFWTKKNRTELIKTGPKPVMTGHDRFWNKTSKTGLNRHKLQILCKKKF